MPAPKLNSTPSVKRKLRTLGAQLKTARILRKLPMELIAERAGSTRSTLYRIEKGDPNVRVGSYLMVMQALGILDGFADLEDALGGRLIRESLPKRARPRG